MDNYLLTISKIIEKLIYNGFLDFKKPPVIFKLEISRLWLGIQSQNMSFFITKANNNLDLLAIKKNKKRKIRVLLSLLKRTIRRYIRTNPSLSGDIIKGLYKTYFWLKWKKIY